MEERPSKSSVRRLEDRVGKLEAQANALRDLITTLTQRVDALTPVTTQDARVEPPLREESQTDG